ncbi:MAG: FUSC family membrane protein [Bacteroidota bacterium]|nr:FUSC family membrane protein [Bacteroidota bacterium]
MHQKIIKTIGDNHLYAAIKLTIACVVPFFFISSDKDLSYAFAFAIGAVLTASVDIPSGIKHKITGLLLGCVSVPLLTFVLQYYIDIWWIFYPTFVLSVFVSAMIGLYGQRANTLSFALLITISLSFIHSYKNEKLLSTCLFLFLGGIGYALLSILFYYFRPNRYINLEIASCMRVTAKYLSYRAELWTPDANRDTITRELLNLQIKLNELHEFIREYTIQNKAHLTNSESNRKLLISLSSLIDIMELASANIFDHQKIIRMFDKDNTIILQYQKLALGLSHTLEGLSSHIVTNNKYHSPVLLTSELRNLRISFSQYCEKHQLSQTCETYLIFQNILIYIEQQIQKIRGLERVYKGRVNADELRGKYKDIEKFLTPEHYKLSILKENFNFSSSHFRYALRITIALCFGLALGKVLPLQKAYWILLTIIVIMRPGYGLTKQRSKERVLGTLLGGLIAIVFLYFTNNTTTIAIVTIITMIFGNWLAYSNYRIGVTFITIYVILIYGIFNPNYQSLLVYRIIDTLVGTLIAFLATHLLWPSWEFLKIREHLTQSIESVQRYISEINHYYHRKGEPSTAYKLARKQAYIEVGNLMASFQRLTQEPKSKQLNKAELYELAVLNQTLVSVSASIGTYIQSHFTSESSKAFDLVMLQVNNNLEQALNKQTNNEQPSSPAPLSFAQLRTIREEEIQGNYSEEIYQQKLEESRLLIDQLMWMINLSEKIKQVSSKLAQ